MSIPRFHFPAELTVGARVALPAAAAHHAGRVLRLRPGDPVVLFTGAGGEYAAAVETMDRHDLTVVVRSHSDVERESPLDFTLIQAVSSGERMDFTLQKAVELGVTGIVPVLSERSVVRLSGERAAKRVTHWQGVVVAACEQCGRNRVPAVAPLTSLQEALAASTAAACYLLSPDAHRTLSAEPRPAGAVRLLIGPEGGFSAGEERAAVAAGFVALRVGARVLRTETAALATLAAMQALWGDY